ncbi:MAG: hypothetical protein IKQ71_09105 [Lachnospiraceae bacterium]|nr:hypothetical protein [Lachnospiraceae bacterium]
MNKLERLERAKKLATITTIILAISFMINFVSPTIGGAGMTFAVIGGFVAYLIGGFGTALKMAFKIGTIGWVVVPFPYDLTTGGMTFMLAIGVFLFLPIIPINKAYKEYVSGM